LSRTAESGHGIPDDGASGHSRPVTATAAEIAASLPGDDLVLDATAVFDSATTLPAPPSEVWPWLVQLGKGRAGWYFPRWLERFTPPPRRGLRHIDWSMQRIAVGDGHPDWGPGDPVIRVTALEPDRAIVYHSLRDSTANHRWPADGRADRDGVLNISWVLVVSPSGPSGSRLHLRFRTRLKPRRVSPVPLFKLFDRITAELLFAGLRERLAG
jgi:hypothetical protein